MRKGTPNQLIAELENKIADLKGVESAVEVTASEDVDRYKIRFYQMSGPDKGDLDHEEFFGTKAEALKAYRKVFDKKLYNLNPTVYEKSDDGWRRLMGDELVESSAQVIDDGEDVIQAGVDEDVYEDTEAIFYPELNHRITLSELKEIYQELIEDGDPCAIEYDDFDSWLADTIDSGYLRKVNACDSIMSDEAVEVEEEVNETTEDSDDADDAEVDYHDDYLDELYTNVEDALAGMLEEVSWSSDDENIYMDVSFQDGHVFTFTIPREDLIYDMENMDTDVNYICDAVRNEDSSEPEEEAEDVDEAEWYDESDYYDEDGNPPVYL